MKRIFDLPIGPGIYTEQSERGAIGRWRDGDKVRFRKGLPEKVGGWVQLQPQFQGTARRLRDWTSLDGQTWSAIATEKKLYLWQQGNPPVLYDITPLRAQGTLTNPFDTTIGSAVVTVTDSNHGGQPGDFVRFSGASAVGGLTIDGEYTISSITQNTYTIVDDQTATATSTGGGTVDYEYDISVGATSATTVTGYGTGGWGLEGYGDRRENSTVILDIRTWSLDNWGEDLLACPRGGAIYWWDRSKGADSRAVALGGDAPIRNEGVIISQRDRHVIALGAYDFFNDTFDPLLIRWSSTEDLNDWVPTNINTSGDVRLYSGSKIVTAVRSRLELVVWTDVSVHTLPYISAGNFGLNIVGENVSILGPNCAVPVDSRVFFMAESDFYVYDGIVRVQNCDVRNYVYENLNVDQKDKIYGGLNREFNEIWWFYPSFDPDTWVQQTFELGLPPGYSLATNSAAPPNLYNDVIFQADFNGTNGATTFTDQSSYAATSTFLGTAQLSTTTPAEGSASLSVANQTGTNQVTYSIAAGAQTALFNATYLTAELKFKVTALPGFGTNGAGVIFIGDDDASGLQVKIDDRFGTEYFLRAGFGQNSIWDIPGNSLLLDTWYNLIIEEDYSAGASNGVQRVWFDREGTGSATLLGTNTGITRPNSLGTNVIVCGSGTVSNDNLNGNLDFVRVTASQTAARYGDATSVTFPTSYETDATPNTSDIGYVYTFDAAGYTEVAATADNNYEHDYVLTNADPILTPTTSEYAVELDVNPDIGMGTGLGGLSFLRTDLTGAAETDADDCQQFMVELDYSGNLVQIVKKEGAAPVAPDNLMANTIDFTTLTGSAMATGQKYIIDVQFNTPTVTVRVDGNQAFQFDLSTAELALFTSGTFGLHMRSAFPNDNQYRFYNLASGPIGTITASDFDISPIEVNRYVAFNYEEQTWSYGKLSRTAWADRSPLLEKPYAAGTDGYLYQHETGTDDNGNAMQVFVESFDLEIPEAGEYLMHVDQLIPDFLTLEGEVDIYLTGRKYPQDGNRITKGPYTVTPGTRKLSTRMRARQVAVRMESNTNGDKWRSGTLRGRASPHGKRG